VYKILVGKPEGKKVLGRCRRTWDDNIKMNRREIKCEGVDWIVSEHRWAVRKCHGVRAVIDDELSHNDFHDGPPPVCGS
jgi:hypothetical protein